MLGLFLAALLVRLLAALVVHDWVGPEDWEYGAIADNLLAGKGYSGSAWFVAEGKTAFMAPLYVFLLYSFKVTFVSGAYIVLQLFQCVIGAGSAVLLFLIGRQIFDQRIGFLAAALLAFNLVHAYLPTQMHPLVFTCTLLTACVYLGILNEERRKRSLALALGFLLGVSMLADPAIVCFLPIAAALPLVTRPRDWRRGLGLLALTLASAAVAVAPWTIRNYLVFHRFILVKSPLGLALWMGNHEGATGTQVFVDEERNARHATGHLPPGLRERLHQLGEPEAYNELGRLARDFMRRNPGEAAWLALNKARYFWWYPASLTCPECQQRPLRSPIHHPEKLVWGPVLGLAVVGAVVRRREWRRWLSLVTPLAAFTLLYAITNVGSNIRYRIPIEPFVMVFSAAALEALLLRKRGVVVASETESAPLN